jgi:hypothetical protein
MKQSHGYDVWFAEERTWTARVTKPAVRGKLRHFAGKCGNFAGKYGFATSNWRLAASGALVLAALA